MPAFTIGDIVRGTRGALLGGDLGIAVGGISIDSRSLGVGEAFFAIHGERLDGHGFLVCPSCLWTRRRGRSAGWARGTGRAFRFLSPR